MTDTLVARYLDRVRSDYRSLDFRGIARAEMPVPIEMDHVFVPLYPGRGTRAVRRTRKLLPPSCGIYWSSRAGRRTGCAVSQVSIGSPEVCERFALCGSVNLKESACRPRNLLAGAPCIRPAT